MIRSRLKLILLLLLPLFGCTWDKAPQHMRDFPEEIGAILINNCAVSGCHNAASAEAAAGLNMSSWNDLFKGSRGGSAVIPYSPELSYLLYAINTDPVRGITLDPAMPINNLPLTDAQYHTLRDWIEKGAKNAKGEDRFPASELRRKWYVVNQGCDMVAVFDAESRQVMRYVRVGQNPNQVESPHMVKVSKDGKFWYLIYLTANPYLEKYSTVTDELVRRIYIGPGDWNTLSVSPDGKYAFAVAYNGKSIAMVDLERDSLAQPVLTFANAIHGSYVHPNQRKLYVTLQDESGLFVLEYNSAGAITGLETVDLVQGTPPQTPGELWPHELIFNSNGSKYFVSCQRSNEVRVFDGNDVLQAVIPVGDWPSEFAISPSKNLCFVTCMEDVSSFPSYPNRRGSVAVIDMTNNVLTKTIYTGYQPHGLAVDEVSGMVIVANRNQNPAGPAPHHAAACGTRNGYVGLIDMHTLQLVTGYKPEMSNDPYAVAVKY